MKKKNLWKFVSSLSLISFSLPFLVSCASNSIFGIYPNNILPPSSSLPPSTPLPPDNNLPPTKPTPPPVVPNPNPNFDPTKIDQFDFNYNNSHKFSNPLYVNNKIVGIDLPGNGPSPTLPGNNIIGNAKLLTQKLPNQHYVDLAKKSYALEIVNGLPKNGTAWILDYKLPNDNSYPVTWYFGSNAHVLDDLRIKNNQAYPYNFAEWKNNKFSSFNTSEVNLVQPKNPDSSKTFESYSGISNNSWKKASINLTVSNPDKNDPNWEWEGYYSDQPKVKTVFMGNDFMSNDPKDYLEPSINIGNKFNSWFNNKEYADFGVIEVTFPSAQIAEDITNGYANLSKEKQFKYKKTDLIQQYERKEQYVVSFPSEIGSNYKRELMVNKPKSEYDSGNTSGGQLGTSPHYSTFKSKQSILDVGIGFSYFGALLEKYDNKNSINDNMFFNSWGLMYQLDYANLNPGASGSLTIDQDGYSLGVLFGSDPTASIGLIQAFYSSGFSYSGYYGKYNLPAYDLIRGGMPNQQKSYYDGLVMLYGKDANFKTNLFPNGLVSRN